MPSESRNSKIPTLKTFLVGWWVVVACLIIVSTSGPDLTRSRLGLVMFVTMSSKARLDQVDDMLVKASARSLTIFSVY